MTEIDVARSKVEQSLMSSICQIVRNSKRKETLPTVVFPVPAAALCMYSTHVMSSGSYNKSGNTDSLDSDHMFSWHGRHPVRRIIAVLDVDAVGWTRRAYYHHLLTGKPA